MTSSTEQKVLDNCASVGNDDDNGANMHIIHVFGLIITRLLVDNK